MVSVLRSCEGENRGGKEHRLIVWVADQEDDVLVPELWRKGEQGGKKGGRDEVEKEESEKRICDLTVEGHGVAQDGNLTDSPLNDGRYDLCLYLSKLASSLLLCRTAGPELQGRFALTAHVIAFWAHRQFSTGEQAWK